MPGHGYAAPPRLRSSPGCHRCLDAVVAGSFAGLAALALDLGTAASLTLGTAAFLAAVISFVAYAFRTIASYRRALVTRFPTP